MVVLPLAWIQRMGQCGRHTCDRGRACARPRATRSSRRHASAGAPRAVPPSMHSRRGSLGWQPTPFRRLGQSKGASSSENPYSTVRRQPRAGRSGSVGKPTATAGMSGSEPVPSTRHRLPTVPIHPPTKESRFVRGFPTGASRPTPCTCRLCLRPTAECDRRHHSHPGERAWVPRSVYCWGACKS